MNNSALNTLVGLIGAMQLKDRIKEAMDAAKLTKAALARATKASPGAITQWLSGETKSLKAETAAGIERATGYRASWIVDGKGEKLVASKANQDLATVDIAQTAIKDIATLEQSLEGLAHYMAGLNESDRAEVMRSISVLEKEPDRHAKQAAGIRATVGTAFVQSARKAA